MHFTSLTNNNSIIILIGLYDIISDFHVRLQKRIPIDLPKADNNNPPTKKAKLPIKMMITLMLFKFFVGHRSWKEYYDYLKTHHNGVNIGYLPSYGNFMKSMHRLSSYALIFLEAIRRHCKKGVNIQFADGSCLPVCRIKREFTHKIHKNTASKSKGTMGWYYGFKIHLVCDDRGLIIAWKITTATVDDRKGLSMIWTELTGIIVADAGYLGKAWSRAASDLNLKLITGVKKIMKKLMSRWEFFLLKARQCVETVFSTLKFRMGMDTTLARSTKGLFAHYVWCLLAYQLKRMGQIENKVNIAISTGAVA
jgi:transposase